MSDDRANSSPAYLGSGVKTTDAFRTISEVSELLHIPQSVLRFWETRFSQIRPMKRTGGRRYYRPDDVALLRSIQTLLYGQGYTIKGVQRILKELGAREVVKRYGEGGETQMFLAQASNAPVLKPDENANGADIETDDQRIAEFFIAEAREMRKEIEDCLRLLRGARQ